MTGPEPRWRATSMEEGDWIDWRRTGLRWRPLRAELDADIIGLSGYRAERAGETVVEPHTEVSDGRGQQEVYVVVLGRARFIIDGAELDAPAGTLVRVEPEAHRQAVAVEAGTAVIALGGEPTFVPSPSEWLERARPLVHTDPERAGAILDDLRRTLPDSPALALGDALLAIGRGDAATATRLVRTLAAGRPGMRGVLAQDPDFGPLLGA